MDYPFFESDRKCVLISGVKRMSFKSLNSARLAPYPDYKILNLSLERPSNRCEMQTNDAF